MERRKHCQEDQELDHAYQALTGSDPRIKPDGCGCLPFITVVLLGLILLFLIIAGTALMLSG